MYDKTFRVISLLDSKLSDWESKSRKTNRMFQDRSANDLLQLGSGFRVVKKKLSPLRILANLVLDPLAF